MWQIDVIVALNTDSTEGIWRKHKIEIDKDENYGYATTDAISEVQASIAPTMVIGKTHIWCSEVKYIDDLSTRIINIRKALINKILSIFYIDDKWGVACALWDETTANELFPKDT